jgi:hypothetical protein
LIDKLTALQLQVNRYKDELDELKDFSTHTKAHCLYRIEKLEQVMHQIVDFLLMPGSAKITRDEEVQ